MEDHEFRRLLALFPVVRSRNYHADSEIPRQGTSSACDELREWQNAWAEGDKKETEIQGIDQEDAFWKKLKLIAERKVGAVEADRFCKAFQKVHKKLVYEALSLEAAQSFIINSSANPAE